MNDRVSSAGAAARLVVLRRALGKRCPACGEGPLFASRFRLAARCPRCALVYRREQGSMTGQMYLSAVVTEIFAAALALALFLVTDWSEVVALSVGVPLVLAFSYFTLPRSMAAWVAIEYLVDRANGELGPPAR